MTAKDPLPQSRYLATEIPGPLSTAAMQRRKEAVAGGLGTALPVIVKRAQDAIIEDIDGDGIRDLLYFPINGEKGKPIQIRIHRGLRAINRSDVM